MKKETMVGKQHAFCVLVSLCLMLSKEARAFASTPVVLQMSQFQPTLVTNNESAWQRLEAAVANPIPLCLNLTHVQQGYGDYLKTYCANMPLMLTIALLDAESKFVPSHVESEDLSKALPVIGKAASSNFTRFRAGFSKGEACFSLYPMTAAVNVRVDVALSLLTSSCLPECSDGNSVPGDGCDENGVIESGYACTPKATHLPVNDTSPAVHHCSQCPLGHYSSKGSPCTVARSCRDVLAADCRLSSSGLYHVHLPGNNEPSAVFCDMLSQGGPWMLMTKFVQKGGAFSVELSQSDYDGFFKNNNWIKGAAQGVPSSPSFNASAFDSATLTIVESWDWRKQLLTAGSGHRLRQRVENLEQKSTFDVHFSFSYGGVVTQNDASSDGQKKWDLSDRRILEDTTGFSWTEAAGTAMFWLPITQGFSGNGYSACNYYSFDTTICELTTDANRRYGNAGILHTSQAGETAYSWLPHTYAGHQGDSAFIHGSHYYRQSFTGDDIIANYWLAQGTDVDQSIPPTCSIGNVDECAFEGLNNCHPIGATCVDTPTSFMCKCKDGWLGDGVSCSPVNNCSSLLLLDPSTPSGLYHLLATNIPTNVSSAQLVYCDMVTSGGPWALVSKIVQRGIRPSGVSQADYDMFGNVGLWMHGSAHMRPYNEEYVHGTLASTSFQSIDWRFILKTSGQNSRLRQTVVNVAQNRKFDAHWAFTYGGITRQNDASSDSEKLWALSNRTVVTDTTAINWDSTAEQEYFFLPYQPGYNGNVYDGANGYFFGVRDGTVRRYGTTGVIAPSAGQTDHAIPWFGLMDQNTILDFFYVHQAHSVFGQTGGQDMYGMYWLQF